MNVSDSLPFPQSRNFVCPCISLPRSKWVLLNTLENKLKCWKYPFSEGNSIELILVPATETWLRCGHVGTIALPTCILTGCLICAFPPSNDTQLDYFFVCMVTL